MASSKQKSSPLVFLMTINACGAITKEFRIIITSKLFIQCHCPETKGLSFVGTLVPWVLFCVWDALLTLPAYQPWLGTSEFT